MTLIVNWLGYLVNLCLFLLMRKRKEKMDLVLSLAVGILLDSSMYHVIRRLLCMFPVDNADMTAGWLMLLPAFGVAAYWGWNGMRLQDYHCEKSRILAGTVTAAAMLLLGRALDGFLSVELVQNLLLWGAGGIMFHAAIEVRTGPRALRILGALLSILYSCGYPMANLLSGNALLALAMNWLLLVFRCTEGHEEGRTSLGDLTGVLACALIVLAICFQPGYLLCVMLAAPGVLRTCRQDAARFRQVSGVIAAGMVIAVTCVLAGHGADRMYSDYRALAASMYSSLWSDCAFWIFPLLVFVVEGIRAWPRMDWKLYWLMMAVVTWLFCLGGSILWRRDSLDGYNMSYILWLIVMYVAAKGMIHTYKDHECVTVSYMLVLVATLVLMLSGAEEHLQGQNVWFCTQARADSFLGVYSWNRNVLSGMREGVSPEQQELYDRAGMLAGEGGTIPYVIGDDMAQIRHFCERTGQEDCWRYFYQMQSVLLNARQMQPEAWKHYVFNKYDNVPYILIKKNSDLYWYGIGMYGQMEVIHENDFGMLLKVEME